MPCYPTHLRSPMFPFVLGFLLSLTTLPIARSDVQVSTPISLSPSAQLASITSFNGQTFATGATAAGVGVIYQLNLNAMSASVVAGSVVRTIQDGIGTNAGLYAPNGLVIDPRANSDSVYFVDSNGIRKLVISSATVTSVVGNSKPCATSMPDPSNGLANQTTACRLSGITMDNIGNLYYLDTNILRVFHVDLGTVTTLVGSYNGNPTNPTQYIDSVNGATAYMGGPNSIALAENGAGLWILDSAGVGSIHFVNLSHPYPMVTRSTTNSSGTAGSSFWQNLCSSGMSSNSIYLLATCSSASTSGQIMSVDLNSLLVTNIAGGGSCQHLDGQAQSASFAHPAACVSASATSSGEVLLVVDIASISTQTGIIRKVDIGNAPTIPPSSSTTPSPGGHSSFAVHIAQSPLISGWTAVLMFVGLQFLYV